MSFYHLRDPRNHTRIAVASNTHQALSFCISPLSATPPPPGLFDLRLYDRSLLTDCVMDLAGGFGSLFISDRFRAVLDQVKLPPHRYVQGRLIQKGKVYRNYQCLITESLNQKPPPFDMERSEFYRLKGFAKFDAIAGPVKFKTWRQAERVRGRADLYESILDGRSIPDGQRTDAKLFLTSAATQYDLFHCSELGSGLFISEALYHLLVEAQLTGMDLREATWLASS